MSVLLLSSRLISTSALDPRVIAKGFANDGQDVPAVGQVASLTSTNNFINFCLTVANTPITDGKQVTTGSCNPAPIGVIPSTDNMPSSKFVTPTNFGTVQADTPFTISMAINNIETGNFVNAQENYFAAPQQLTSSGLIIGHTHVVVETIDSLDQKTPTNPKNFAFFKGVNGKAVNGVVTADVTNGLPAGVYRLCSINSSSNHQPVIVPVAQHGSLDDCVYFTSTANGKAAGIVASSQAGARASATATAISSSGAVSASVSDSAAVNTNAVASSAIVSATAVASDASASVTGVASAVGPTDVPSASAIDNGADVSSSATDAVPSASDDSGNGREGNKKGHGKGK
ncbi:hypothetical protein CPB85DRAFT_1212143 [Mucidula mucida]|nr:hypothetical protein CPB85DRAFT_1212143 [Mucidula mucida]